MRMTLVRGTARRSDHSVIDKALGEVGAGISGRPDLRIGVVNEFGSVYLEVEPADGLEFNSAVACLQCLGFGESHLVDRALEERYRMVMAIG